VLALAGGASVPDFAVFVSGLMMGTLASGLDGVVTKTTAALIVLPRRHHLVARRERTGAQMARIGKSACDQCSYCTEFCPRYLLGYEIVPHKVMRSLGFTATGADHWNQWAQLCCGCGICTLYACPEDLYPKEACDKARTDLRAAGIKFVQKTEPAVHPMKEYRRVPLDMLRRRLEVERYEAEAPFEEVTLEPARVRIKLFQHAGKPARAVVAAGDQVRPGDPVGSVDRKDLGAAVHASIGGAVAAVTPDYVEIVR
jgi:Na+-translocating ferredoxin:NAD+ oxidoreductase RnfC subunit